METFFSIIWWIVKTLVVVLWWTLPFLTFYFHKEDKQSRTFFGSLEIIYSIIFILGIHILFWMLWFPLGDFFTINVLGSVVVIGILAWDIRVCNQLIGKYGEEYGLAIFQNTYMVGMTTEMLIRVMGDAHYVDNLNDKDKWYYNGKHGFSKVVVIKDDKIDDFYNCKNYWIDMPKYLLMESIGYAFEEKKETVTRDDAIARYYFYGHTTSHGNRKYKLEITIEKDTVIKIKDL